MSPYRSPPLRPLPRVEAMRVRRYPLFLQIFIAVCFPLTAIVTAELYPDTTFSCKRAPASGAVACLLDTRTAFRHHRDVIDATPTTVNTFEYGPDLLGIGKHRFDLPLEVARTIKVRYETFLHQPQAPSLTIPLQSVSWLMWLCAIAEVSIGLFYFLGQVRIHLRADLDEGTVAIQREQRLRSSPMRTIVLADVDAFRIDDLTDDAKGHAVVARMRSGADSVLLTTVRSAAAQTLHFLQSAKARASEEFPLGAA